jgi:hypothetical protein
MIQYKEINVNPKNRKTGDCSTRALVGVLGISYAEALKLQFEESLQCYYDPTSKQVMERVLKRFGYIKMAQPRRDDGTKYEVREIDEIVSNNQMKNGILVTVANHHTCVKNGYIQDTWNCGHKCIGNYYVKG